MYNDTTVQVLARFANTGINAPYYIRTVGIYGTPQGGSETLIAVAVVCDLLIAVHIQVRRDTLCDKLPQQRHGTVSVR